MADTDEIALKVHVIETLNWDLEEFKELQCKKLSQGLDMHHAESEMVKGVCSIYSKQYTCNSI